MSNNGSGAGFYPQNFTIWQNYFGNFSSPGYGPSIFAAEPWASFQGNFYRYAASAIGPSMINLTGNTSYNIWLLDEPQSNNPHGPYITTASTSNMTSEIVDHAGEIAASTAVSAFYQTNLPNLAINYSFTNSILLPNESGNTSWWINALINPSTAGQTVTLDHNTVMANFGVGQGEGTVSYHPGVGASTPTGMLASYRSNIIWNPLTTSKTYKLFSFCTETSCAYPNLNPCLPANCDYNLGWNTMTDGAGYSNGGNGYADTFTSVPGQHDLPATVNPMFVDPTRNTVTFDSAYLGYTQTAWNAAGGTNYYSVGQMVSFTDPSLAIWNGATVNYRYINSTYYGGGPGGVNGSATCSGANPKPGDYTLLSRACWEWATLYDIRQALSAVTTQSGTCPGVGAHAGVWSTQTGIGQCLWDDQGIGAHGYDIIMTLEQWIRAGYAPQNSLLSGAAHDGTDIGAVPVAFAAQPLLSTGCGTASFFGTVKSFGTGTLGGCTSTSALSWSTLISGQWAALTSGQWATMGP
jgi:hypothetical protein